MTDGLTKKLVALFWGKKPTEVRLAVEEALKIVLHDKKEKFYSLFRLFDTQMETLKVRGCPRGVIDVLAVRKREVIARAMEMEIADGHIPFIPVVPRTEVNLGDLMKMVRNRDRGGVNYLDQREVFDVVDVPREPYFMLNVAENEKNFIVEEGIALCIHTDVLSKHRINCRGSRYESGDESMSIAIYRGEPRLSWFFIDHSLDESVCASCACRI